MVVDHLRHPSLELGQVEARVVKVAVAIAHAMYFRFPLLYLQQVMDLEAIVVAHHVQEVLEAHKVQQEHQNHQEGKIWRRFLMKIRECVDG